MNLFWKNRVPPLGTCGFNENLGMFWEGLGRVLGGVWEVLGGVWEVLILYFLLKIWENFDDKT